ncbi:MAG: LacI family DNA-binding transcriptional regulator [Bacteroidota bacterium]
MSLKLIAEKANVSVTTVSRVINNHPYVKPNVASKVRLIIKEIGYENKPKWENGLKTGYVGMLIINHGIELLKTPITADLITAIDKELGKNNLQMAFQVIDKNDPLPIHVNNNRMDGAFLLGMPTNQHIKQLSNLHSIVLNSFRDVGLPLWSDTVSIDYEERGRLAALYLLKKGHVKVAYINPLPKHLGSKMSLNGFTGTLEHFNIPLHVFSEGIENEYVIWDALTGQKIIEKIVDKVLKLPAKEFPTGIYVCMDEVTVGVYKALKERGIIPGKDIEIISNNNELAHLSKLDPKPASIDNNLGLIAKKAVEHLLYRIKNPGEPKGYRILVPPKIVTY